MKILTTLLRHMYSEAIVSTLSRTPSDSLCGHAHGPPTQDDLLPDDCSIKPPQRDLYDIGAYLLRDIVQTMFRLSQQRGKFDSFLKHVDKETAAQFKPEMFKHDVRTLKTDVKHLRWRLDASKERGNMGLTSVCSSFINYPLIQVADSLCPAANKTQINENI